MTQEIYVPPGEQGDEIAKQIIPNLHKIARRERNLGD